MQLAAPVERNLWQRLVEQSSLMAKHPVHPPRHHHQGVGGAQDGGGALCGDTPSGRACFCLAVHPWVAARQGPVLPSVACPHHPPLQSRPCLSPSRQPGHPPWLKVLASMAKSSHLWWHNVWLLHWLPEEKKTNPFVTVKQRNYEIMQLSLTQTTLHVCWIFIAKFDRICKMKNCGHYGKFRSYPHSLE